MQSEEALVMNANLQNYAVRPVAPVRVARLMWRMETVSQLFPIHNPGTLTVYVDGNTRTVRYHPNYFRLLKYFINIISKLWLSMTSLEILV